MSADAVGYLGIVLVSRFIYCFLHSGDHVLVGF